MLYETGCVQTIGLCLVTGSNVGDGGGRFLYRRAREAGSSRSGPGLRPQLKMVLRGRHGAK